MSKVFKAYIGLDGEADGEKYYEPFELKQIPLTEPEYIFKEIKKGLREYEFDDITLISEEDFMALDFSDKAVGHPTKIIAEASDDDLIVLFLYSDFFCTAADYLIEFTEEL